MTAPEDGDTGGPLSAERNRLLSLIDFSQHSARLRGKPVARVAAHGLFALHEHEVQGLPGIRLDVTGPENEDELWLAVDRLHETQPPQISSSLLLPWVQLAAGPLEPPRLRDVVVGASLIAAGTHCSAASLPQLDKRSIPPDQTVLLSEYDKCDTVKAQFSVYIDSNWAPWAAEEKRRRATIRLYSKLFTLKQKLEGGIVEDQLEFVWGVGVGVWKPQNATVSYPLLGRLVELSLNPVTAAIEIRPRDVDARLEVDWYASVDNPGLAALEKSAKEFFGKAATTFSPFDRGTFESLLRTAATNLDANGIYWPNEVVAQDRTLPPANDKLTVTDTWVLFARPRTNNIFLQDLETLKDRVEHAQFLPPAVRAVVTDPDARSQVLALPTFRGVSASYSFEPQTSTVKARDLYFPKAFNDEQVRIIQLLDKSDGVVVQGPPGTGKTHTIANVICHYLAEGKRVLVTSMKDPALAVLQEQLPEPIRPLAISLLTSEQDGLKQFEHAIQKIATEVQSLDRGSTAKAIDHLAASIDALHGRLSTIDREVGDWAKQNLNAITLENENIDPQDAARQVTEGVGNYEWIPDMLGISAAFAPAFSDTDVVQLRVARRALGPDIDYLYASPPQLADFPEGNVLLAVHQDLSQLEQLKREVAKGNVPVLADSTPDTIVRCHEVLAQLQALPRRRSDALQGHQSWTGAIRERLRRAGEDNVLPILEALGVELERAVQQRKVFLERPVTAPPGIECDTAIIDAVRNLAVGKRPFGLSGLFGKAALKQQLDSIRVLGSVPAAQDGWKHVDEYLACLRLLRELALRWNVLATELQLDVKQTEEPDGGIAAAEAYKCYLTVKEVVRAEAELCNSASLIFPNWATIRDLADTTQRLDELEHALQHYITRNRLASVWAQKQLVEKVLEGRTGRVIADIRQFFSGTLGNPQIDDAAMQAQWTALMAELSRVQGLGSHLRAVREGCNKIEDSGARELAELLRQPLDGTVDAILPDNWRSAWRLRRLATHLESIDCQEHLKRFSKDREGVASDLARAYRDIVVKRTWLRLAENASPSIRAALQAYLNAIQKIGKGTGKRAVRYRQDARMAASQANPAVPCWIMPHYRVSEALPAELGCFDLVVIDEASQSDFTALPSLLRAKQVLIVGDDKQVSPEGVGLEEEKVRSLMSRFLGEQVDTFRPQMSPERSIYDLFKVVFATSTVMLKEHFRCVGPIIEYSKREFYNHELRPLRMPKASERLDPPLIDVIVQDGYRRNDVNRPEAQFIVDEVKAIVADPRMGNRSIGVVSLLADKQALFVWDRLANELGPEVMRRHRIACGDARTFQGKERDIMFLSMVAAPNEVGVAPSRDTFAQRFNVAASRARDRMYLVRSVDHGHLSEADLLRRAIIAHFATPFAQDEQRVENLRTLCESPFEREMYDELAQRGYWITPQVRVGQFRIDMVVEGHNDARLAVECDGDKYHGVDKWADDMQRQRVLERAGWVFWRCFASAFIRRKTDMLKDLVKTLEERGIDPIGAEGAPRSVHTERRVVTALGRVPDVQVGTEVDSLAGLAIL